MTDIMKDQTRAKKSSSRIKNIEEEDTKEEPEI